MKCSNTGCDNTLTITDFGTRCRQCVLAARMSIPMGDCVPKWSPLDEVHRIVEFHAGCYPDGYCTLQAELVEMLLDLKENA